MKKFYSVINQSLQMSIAEYGDIEFTASTSGTDTNAAEVEEFFKKYITKYLAGLIQNEKESDYIYNVTFLDGSGFKGYKAGAVLYIFYRLNMNTPSSTTTNMDGKNEFLFTYDGTNKRIMPFGYNSKIKDSKASCYQTGNAQRHQCAGLIMHNGWKIPDDYPWIR